MVGCVGGPISAHLAGFGACPRAPRPTLLWEPRPTLLWEPRPTLPQASRPTLPQASRPSPLWEPWTCTCTCTCHKDNQNMTTAKHPRVLHAFCATFARPVATLFCSSPCRLVRLLGDVILLVELEDGVVLAAARLATRAVALAASMSTCSICMAGAVAESEQLLLADDHDWSHGVGTARKRSLDLAASESLRRASGERLS